MAFRRHIHNPCLTSWNEDWYEEVGEEEVAQIVRGDGIYHGLYFGVVSVEEDKYVGVLGGEVKRGLDALSARYGDYV